MDNQTISNISKIFINAENTKTQIPPIQKTFYGVTARDAYEIQKKVVNYKISKGDTIVGKKMGTTSLSMQKHLCFNEPCYGYLFNTMIISEYDSVSISSLIEPKVEAEIAFVLEKDLKGPGITISHVLQATAAITPVLEIVDCRIENWQVNVEDAIADNAFAAKLVLSNQMSKPWNIDLKTMGLVLEKNGKYLDSAAGAAVMGNPALAVAWLANKLSEYGDCLKANEIILPGAFTRSYEVEANDYFQAHFSQIGSVGITFVA